MRSPQVDGHPARFLIRQPEKLPKERLMSASNLAAWNIDPSEFPVTETAIDKARFAVGYAILAPSSHNTQPWRLIVKW
jgi:hypothetical protein